MSRKITLEEWAALKFSKPPKLNTLRLWARDCRIFPVPQKVGRAYYVDPDARYINPNEPTNGTQAA